MSKDVSTNRFLKRCRLQSLAVFFGLAVGIPATGLAADLNLSNNALEVVIGVEPNIMILTDDSGSMDWSTMNSEPEGVAHLPANTGIGYWYVHPAPGASGSAPAINTWAYVVPSEEFMAAQGLAAPQGGVWRHWNFRYNKIYYNPHLTYTPWEGVDSSGNSYTDASPTAAPYDPYYPANGTLDLTAVTTYDTDCGLAECAVIPALTGVFTVTDFYPARYYVWRDTNSITPANAGNGIVDADDDHLLVEIKSTTASYSGRLAFNESTGVGRSDCTDNGDGTATCTYAQEIQNFANWFTYYRKRDLTAKAAFSGAIKPAETARIGYATINNSGSDNLRVASMNVSPASGAKKVLLDKLFSTSPSGFTPLRRALNKTGKYFKCDTGDIFGSGSSSTPGSANCPVEAAPAGQCQQNFTILMTDGYWNGSDPQIVNGGGSSSSSNNIDDDGGDFAGGAFADTYNDTLADVAMYYYKNDLHTTLSNDVPTTAKDMERYLGSTDPFETMHQHMTTYTVGFGVDGTLTSNPSDPSAAFTWPDPMAGYGEKIDDLRHAAYNGRGSYLSAANPRQLVTAMESIFNDIQTATGTATAVAFNTQEIESGTLVFRASFNTKTNKGDLVAQRINSDGSVDPGIVWSAAEELDNKISSDSDTRTIVTFKDTGSATSEGAPFQWTDLTTGAGSQQALLDAPQPTNVPAATNTFGDERVGYLRGHDENEGDNYADGEFRERPEVAGKLGDIVHSTPVFVGKPHFFGRDQGAYPQTIGQRYSDFADTYENRRQITYVGANDGMLHAFDTSSGEEVFAYVPNLVVENLSDLTDPDYSHQYYVDAKPSINDVYITPANGTNAGSLSWNTVIVGGLAGGGKGYYALNVTNPNALDSEAEAKDNVMWEFTEADDGGVGNSDLGFSFSEPLLAMSNADDGSGNKVWIAIFGNGYNSTSADGDAVLYILRIEGGQDGVWSYGSDFLKVSTGNGKAESADGTTPNGIGGIRAIDTDRNGTVDYVYAGDLQGNVYRFDLTSSTASDWTTAPNLLFKARYKAGSAFPRDTVQPITTKPMVIKHPEQPDQYIVIVGTGSWMTVEDATDTNIQSIYGIWDDMSSTPEVLMSSTTNQLVEQVFTNHTSTEHGYTVRTLTNNPVAWRNTGSAANKVKGWYIDLDVPEAGGTAVEYPGERAVRNIQVRGGILFVNTIIPKDTSACSAGSGGYELAFNPITGGSGSTTIFDLNGDNEFDVEDNVGDVDGDGNIVTGVRFDTDTPTDSAFIGSRRMTQAGDEIRSMNTNTNTGAGIGRTSWREITQ